MLNLIEMIVILEDQVY